MYNSFYLNAIKEEINHSHPKSTVTRESLREALDIKRKNAIEKKPKMDKKEIKNKVETKPLKKEIIAKEEKKRVKEESKKMEEEKKEDENNGNDSIEDLLNAF